MRSPVGECGRSRSQGVDGLAGKKDRIPGGLVIAGTIGGAGKLEFTLIGDTVNVAARVEQLTKTTADAILLTHQTVDALVTRPHGLTDRGSHALKGKSAAIQVFGLDPATPSTC